MYHTAVESEGSCLVCAVVTHPPPTNNPVESEGSCLVCAVVTHPSPTNNPVESFRIGAKKVDRLKCTNS